MYLDYLDYLDYLVHFLLAELDGSHPMNFCCIDPSYAMERHAGKPKFKKKLRAGNSQAFDFIQPPGIFHGAFQLRKDVVWFGKMLLLFEAESKLDIGFKKHFCAFVSVVEEYDGQRRPDTLFIFLIVLGQLRST